MKILFVDSGGPGFAGRYSYDIYSTLTREFQCITRQVSPQNLSPNGINSFHPDIFLVIHGSMTPPSLARHAKACGAITVLWLVEDPYEIDHHRGEMANSYDYVFSNEKQAIQEYARPNVYYLPWCCNPKVHRIMSVPGNYNSDLCFVGMGFKNRVRILNAIEPWIQHLNVKLIGDWQSWGEQLHPGLKRFVLPTIHDFWEVQKYYNGAKINLNIHRDPCDPPSGNNSRVGAISPNDRTFALAGCGAFQLVDKTRPGLWECFSEGTEIIGFNDPNDLGHKINHFLSNPSARKSIGRAAQRRVYMQHTYKHRLMEIFRITGRPVRCSTHWNSTGNGGTTRTYQNSQYNPNAIIRYR